jgi:hypothetical protein
MHVCPFSASEDVSTTGRVSTWTSKTFRLPNGQAGKRSVNAPSEAICCLFLIQQAEHMLRRLPTRIVLKTCALPDGVIC